MTLPRSAAVGVDRGQALGFFHDRENDRGRLRLVAERVGRLGCKCARPRLVVEERADLRQGIVKEPQERLVHHRDRQLGRDRPAELVDRRDLELDRFAGPTTGLVGAIVTRKSRSTSTSSLAASSSLFHIRVAVSVKFGNWLPSIDHATALSPS